MLLEGMLESGDPVGWYAKYLPTLTEDQKKYLKAYALDKYSDPGKILSSAPVGAKYIFRYLVDGETAYNMQEPDGGATWNKFRSDPQAALNELQSKPMYRQALGGLYDYTVTMLKNRISGSTAETKAAATEQKQSVAQEKAIVDGLFSTIKTSSDIYAAYARALPRLTSTQATMLLSQMRGIKDFSQEKLEAALRTPPQMYK